MSKLIEEIEGTRKRISREVLDMSIGELASLYESGEIIISPPYQRLYRWEPEQKTRLIESIFLNVPIPPIFVYTQASGKWELVDGLQRLSTCLQFMGKLIIDGKKSERFVCDGTNLVPSLAGVSWPKDDNDKSATLPLELQLNFKRARLRLEVLGPTTDSDVRFELFQHLNSGGSALSQQEIRSCIIYSINERAFVSLIDMAKQPEFLDLVIPSDRQQREQFPVELIVRLVCLRHVTYDDRMDVHEYLNKAIIEICRNKRFSWRKESTAISNTFIRLKEMFDKDIFKKGKHWSLGLYEIVTLGMSLAIEKTPRLTHTKAQRRLDELRNDPALERYTGAGVRGSDRWRGFVVARGYDLFTR